MLNRTISNLRCEVRQNRSRATCVTRAAASEHNPQSRRATLASIAGASALLSGAAPSIAAYGDSANVFGRKTNVSGFVPYAGEGFAVLLPSKWNPSREREFPGMVLRYEDNFDTINYFCVLQQPATKGKISEYGSPDQFLGTVGYLLGQQSYSGETQSEGGFAPNRVAAASILGIGSETDKAGKEFYTYDILTRTADGDEGGKHQLIKATVSGGKLWILKVQVGDKRWFKGVKKEAYGIYDSFIVS